jgi:hypothetical protein
VDIIAKICLIYVIEKKEINKFNRNCYNPNFQTTIPDNLLMNFYSFNFVCSSLNLQTYLNFALLSQLLLINFQKKEQILSVCPSTFKPLHRALEVLLFVDSIPNIITQDMDFFDSLI